ncbi:MAG: DUF4194 domain-containing protein [Burkholderiaceae bacterium]|nr:DUF4194 domain-containing protein [Burkholderiaceae bacterium]
MPANWNALAQKTEGLYEEDDFKRALQQLISYQVLYERNLQQVSSYRLIAQFRNAFQEACDLLGYILRWNDTYNYCWVMPEVTKSHQLDMDETRFLLILRKIYHGRASLGEFDGSGGEISVSIEELSSTHKSVTGKDLPSTQTALRDLLQRVSRYGIAKVGERAAGDLQPFTVTILPAVMDLLSENAISRLGASIKASLVGKAIPNQDHSDTAMNEDEKTNTDVGGQ